MTPVDALSTVYTWLPLAVILDVFVVGVLITFARRRLRVAAARRAENALPGTTE